MFELLIYLVLGYLIAGFCIALFVLVVGGDLLVEELKKDGFFKGLSFTQSRLLLFTDIWFNWIEFLMHK